MFVSMPHAALLVVQGKGTNYRVLYRGFNAARGFVGGARLRLSAISQSFVCFNAARGFVGGASRARGSGEGDRTRFNAARGFVGGASFLRREDLLRRKVSMPHAALLVVQDFNDGKIDYDHWMFQCRTRLCWWCKTHSLRTRRCSVRFNAARGFVGGARRRRTLHRCWNSRFNAARGFVGGARLINI